MYDRNPWETDFGSSWHKVRASEGLSYREWTVFSFGTIYYAVNDGSNV